MTALTPGGSEHFACVVVIHEHRAELDRNRSTCGSASIWSNPGRCWPKSVHIRSKSLKFGRTRAEVGRTRTKCGRSHTSLAESGQDLADVWTMSTEVAQIVCGCSSPSYRARTHLRLAQLSHEARHAASYDALGHTPPQSDPLKCQRRGYDPGSPPTE